MKIISWNTNGLRACLKNGFMDFHINSHADILCVQETKMQQEQLDVKFEGYNLYMNSAIKKGYAGTMVLSIEKPLNVIYGINGEYNDEGRAITLEYEHFYLVNVYSPNSQEGLARLDYRMVYEDRLHDYLVGLDRRKPVVLCGDLNVAHNEIDIKNPKSNRFSAGFSDEERAKFTRLLSLGFVDSFRFLHPSEIKYSWWSYMFHARENNAGWRIDYFVVSERIKEKINKAEILNEVYGSDHCPVVLDINI